MNPIAAPLLVTVDVEIAHDRDLDAQEAAISRIVADLPDFPMTWFCTADAAERFAAPLRALASAGHAIGCHGLDHGDWEDYRRLSPELVRRTLHEATERIERALGVRPRAFRGPRMTTSATTHSTLRHLGYHADFSICSHRLDFAVASCFDWRWAMTGARPYRPSLEKPFQDSGPSCSAGLVVVPLSGLAVPLLSGSLFLLGERLMLYLAKVMSRRAASISAPLVYLFHSYEFVGLRGKTGHLPRHQRLYPAEADKRYEVNLAFLKKLRGMGALPVNADVYVEELFHAI